MKLFSKETKGKSGKYFEQHPYLRFVVGIVILPIVILAFIAQYLVNISYEAWDALKSESRYQFRIFVETVITLFYPPWRERRDKYLTIYKIRQKI